MNHTQQCWVVELSRVTPGDVRDQTHVRCVPGKCPLPFQPLKIFFNNFYFRGGVGHIRNLQGVFQTLCTGVTWWYLGTKAESIATYM